ncbi:MAG: OmpA family protein [Thiomicrorhabdus sp.]|nr:OmpA family protein [Thiomicrorhabdus sp.]
MRINFISFKKIFTLHSNKPYKSLTSNKGGYLQHPFQKSSPPPIQTASTSTQSTLIHLDDQPIIEVTLKDGSFRFGSAKLNPKKREGLTPVLNILNQYPNTTVHIEGHTDSIGSKALNQSLSQKRADSVAAYLVQNGITQERIQTFGYGEERPIADNTHASGRQENRRVVFLIRHP